MAKVIDIIGQIKARNHSENSNSQNNEGAEAEILPLTQVRQKAIRQERRSAKRTMLSEFIAAYVVLPERGLLRVGIFDISEKGMSFDLGIEEGSFGSGEKIAMRIYLNHRTFFSFVVEISNIRFFVKQNIARHGVNYVRGSINEAALHHFVKFIETVSINLKSDDGDMQVTRKS